MNKRDSYAYNPYIGFDDRLMMVVGIPLLALLVLAIFCEFDFSQMASPFWSNYLESVLFTILYWFSLRWIITRLRMRYQKFEELKKRLLIVGLIILFYTPVAGGLMDGLMTWVLDQFEIADNYSPKPGAVIFSTYLVSFLMVSIYEAVYFYYQLQHSIKAQEAAKREHIKSELESLRNQVNPHFLFNSMNTLMNIVQEDQKLATRFLEKLSKVYRYILESRDENLIPLERELEFIKAYVFLQEERFRGNLKVQMDISEERKQDLIIPLCLQILFENVIKHNIISGKKPLHVWVYLDEDQNLVVKNNLQRKKQVLHSTKVGLQNIQTRYQYFSGESITIEETEAFFMVTIPLLTKQPALL